MTDKKENIGLKSSVAGSTLLGASATSIDYAKQLRTFKKAEKVNSKRIDAFLRKLKPGDIIMESDPHNLYTGDVFTGVSPQEIRSKIAAKTGLNIGKVNSEAISKLKFNDVVQFGGGGSRYHHASVYLGNGKIADMAGSGGRIKLIKDEYKKKRMISIRVTEDSKSANRIAKTARDIVKSNPIYRGNNGLVSDTLKRNLTFIKSSPDGFITCTEFANEAVAGASKSGKGYINKFSVDPTDMFNASSGNVKASYNLGKATNHEKMLNFVGKNFRNGKFYIMGAGLGAATAVGFNAYQRLKKKNGVKLLPEHNAAQKSFFSSVSKGTTKSIATSKGINPKNGHWITVKGRRIFVRKRK